MGAGAEGDINKTLDEAHSLQQDCRNIKPIFTERNAGIRTPPQTVDKMDEFKSVSQSPGSPMQPMPPKGAG